MSRLIDSAHIWGDDPDPDPDAFSMRALRDGDPLALQHLVDRHWLELVRFGLSHVDDADLSEDLAQEAFFALWRKREEWDSRSTVRAFLFRVVRNGIAKQARRNEVRERLRPRVMEGFQRPPPSPYDLVVRTRLLQALEEALERLAPRRREVLELARFHGLSHAEIATAMDLSPQTVANHISLALRDLRGMLSRPTPLNGASVTDTSG